MRKKQQKQPKWEKKTHIYTYREHIAYTVTNVSAKVANFISYIMFAALKHGLIGGIGNSAPRIANKYIHAYSTQV